MTGYPGTPSLPEWVASWVPPQYLAPVSRLPGNFLFHEFSGISRFLEGNFKKKKDLLNFFIKSFEKYCPYSGW